MTDHSPDDYTSDPRQLRLPPSCAQTNRHQLYDNAVTFAGLQESRLPAGKYYRDGFIEISSGIEDGVFGITTLINTGQPYASNGKTD